MSYLLSVLSLVLHTVCSILHNHAVLPDYVLLGYEGVVLGNIFGFAVLSIGLGYWYKHIADDRRRLTEQTHQQQQ
ncbi:MAG: hypothetical protein LH609_16170 [Rudanella sp.]|nr:hypothetical protein [Rudanella sp.]